MPFFNIVYCSSKWSNKRKEPSSAFMCQYWWTVTQVTRVFYVKCPLNYFAKLGYIFQNGCKQCLITGHLWPYCSVHGTLSYNRREDVTSWVHKCLFIQMRMQTVCQRLKEKLSSSAGFSVICDWFCFERKNMKMMDLFVRYTYDIHMKYIYITIYIIQ